MSEALYSRDILRLAVSIPHQERLPNPDATAQKRSKTCGSQVTVDVVISQKQRLEKLGIEISACAVGQASAAILAEGALGKTLAEIEDARSKLSEYLAGSRSSPGDWNNIDLLAVTKEYSGRHSAILLSYDTLINAFENALNKREAA